MSSRNNRNRRILVVPVRAHCRSDLRHRSLHAELVLFSRNAEIKLGIGENMKHRPIPHSADARIRCSEEMMVSPARA